MNNRSIREIILILLLMLFVFISATGGIRNLNISLLLSGLAVSVIAAVICAYALKDIYKDSIFSSLEISKKFEEITNILSKSPIIRADRNMDMGEEFWLKMIDELDITPESCWFVGTKLSWWLKTSTYRKPLRLRFVNRLKKISKKQKKTDRDDNFMTYILLTNNDAVANWKAFFKEIVNELTKGNKKKDQLQKLYWSKIKIAKLHKELINYSSVLCGKRLAVTPYTSLGRSEDSPTLEIKYNSAVWHLYINDLKSFKSKII